MSDPNDPCVFCEIVAGRAPAEVVRTDSQAIAIVPLKPVAKGHILVLPRRHVADYSDSPTTSAATMWFASVLGGDLYGSSNVITSMGWEATQSVFHLHFHIVPRRENDGLALPWYSGKRRS